jgi:polygalacturonase
MVELTMTAKRSGAACVALLCLLAAAEAVASTEVWKASEHGVVADGSTDNAQVLQGLIEACAQAGGGTVSIDEGVVVSGMIQLKSGVTLHIAEGATLMNTGNKEAYPYVAVDFPSYYPKRRAMVYAQNAEGVALTGKGTIDGGSDSPNYPNRSPESERVSLVRFDGCQKVTIKDVTLKNATMWTQHYYRCDDVQISGLVVRNYRKNDDGLNIDGCHRVTIENCDISSHDDAITLKTTSMRDNRDVTVTNCRLETVKSAFKFGTESHAGFVNITARNLDIHGGRDAIVLLSTDGGRVENILLEDIRVTGSQCPLFIYLGRRLRQIEGEEEVTKAGSIEGVTIRRLSATGAQSPLIINGLGDRSIQRIVLDDIKVRFVPREKEIRPKKNKKKDLGDGIFIENEKGYPASTMFGPFKAWGLILRHVNQFSLKTASFQHAQQEHEWPLYYQENAEQVQLPSDFLPSFAMRNGKWDHR